MADDLFGIFNSLAGHSGFYLLNTSTDVRTPSKQKRISRDCSKTWIKSVSEERQYIMKQAGLFNPRKAKLAFKLI